MSRSDFPVVECPDRADALADDEVLYENERTLIARRHLADGHTVIVKNAYGADAQIRLGHEAAILARLSSVKGVIRLLSDKGNGSLLFEDLHADSLAQCLTKRRPALDNALQLAIELAHILAEVHHAGVIHKDINPSNVLLAGPDQHPVLIDFNIATSFAQEQQAFTHQSHIAGTLAYMSPEQTGRTGRAVDQRSDLYSLGVTLYELFTGRRPFESEDLLEMIHDHLVRPAPPPANLEAGIPHALSAIILRLLEKEADRRYQSAEGLARDLARLQERLAQGDEAARFPLGQDDFPMRLIPPSTLIGRHNEIALLEEAMVRVSGGEGSALLLSGAPGVGKSALINELQPMVTARRGWFVSGKFEQYQRDTTSAFVQALRALGRLLLAQPAAQRAQTRERILTALGANAGIGPSLLPEFKLLLGTLPNLRIDDPVEAETRMIQATVDVLKSVVSPEQPLVMVVDDLQWAPAISLRFMDALMTRGRGLQGLLLVGAFREQEVDSAHPLGVMLKRWEGLGVCPAIMRLENLPQNDVGTLIGEMLRLPGTEASRLSEVVMNRTEGNPYDTVELINALRQDGLLKLRNGTWDWSEAAIRQYVGDCDVLGLLDRRIEKLPHASQNLMELLACLGGAVNTELLAIASGQGTDAVASQLSPALEDGLLVVQLAHEREIRFRHDRVQQAMHTRMMAGHRTQEVELALARRLVRHPTWSALAAKQYLPWHEQITSEDECRLVIDLFQQASVINRVINYDLCERFLSAAMALMSRITMNDADRRRLFTLRANRHAALYGLGRLEEADAVFDAIVAGSPEPIKLVDIASVQIASLGIRSRHKEAMAIGLGLLDDFGMPQPEDIKMAIGTALFKVAGWSAGPEKELDLTRPEVSDPRILALAKVLSKTQVAAFFGSVKINAWLTMASHGLWVEHGPCASLMAAMCSMPVQLIAIGEDYQGGYTLAKHLLAVGEARRYEPATSVARFMFALSSAHWFEPLEDKLHHYRKAREGLLQAGELQYAIFTFDAWTVQFDVSPHIDTCLEEINGGFTMAARNGDKNFSHIHLPSRQLYRALHGDIEPGLSPGCFDDADFSEVAHEASLSVASNSGAYYHNCRALAAALFNDEAALVRHATAGMPLVSRIPGYYLMFRSHMLYALALCQRLPALPEEDKATALADIDKSLKWMKRRAKDAPFNFLHLQYWIEAERAWATGDLWGATEGFNRAMNEVEQRSRPWHAALITERAGRFHLSQDMLHTGQSLIQAAHAAYGAWGAKAKVAQLVNEFPALRTRHGRKRSANARSTIVSTDMVDVLSVLRASQALSSETSLARLSHRVSEVLGAMTGAASVLLAVRSDSMPSMPSWQVLTAEGEEAATISLENAADQGRLPLSAFRYAELTREPLLLSEATKDERFSRDPYFNGVSQSSMLLLPVLSKGDVRAMLVLENRVSRGTFSSDRLDAVSLIAGQLSVSLDNALLYASLEQKVAERTAALEEANRRLEQLSSTDALTGVFNRRKFNETFEAEWLRAKRTRQPIGLVLIDIDHFKLYNDHYGHQGGDACLQMVAMAMRTGLRPGSDLIARYGGEEFVLLLPDTDIEGTCVVAERVRSAIEARQEPHAKSPLGIITISVGATSFVPTQDTNPSHHIEMADQALYTAKRAGRNRVCRATALALP